MAQKVYKNWLILLLSGLKWREETQSEKRELQTLKSTRIRCIPSDKGFCLETLPLHRELRGLKLTSGLLGAIGFS